MAVANSSITKPQQDRLDFMYDVMKEKSIYIKDSLTTQGNKTNYMFGFTAVATGLYLPLLLQKGYLINIPSLLAFSRLLGMFGLVLALLFLTLATRSRKFGDAPHQDTIYSSEAFNKEYYFLKRQIIADMKAGYVHNVATVKSISVLLNRASWLLFISICIIIISALL